VSAAFPHGRPGRSRFRPAQRIHIFAMSTKGRLLLLGTAMIALAIVALAAWPLLVGTRRPQPGASDGRQRAYHSEQEWIAWQVVSTIAAGAPGARPGSSVFVPDIVVRSRPASAVDLLRAATLDVAIGGAPATAVEVREHVWTMDTYVGLARSLVGPRPARAGGPPAAGASSLVLTLTEPRVDVILAEEARVSAALAKDAADAGAHEEAALLAAALAFRDNAGVFTDVRSLLSLTTGHLALARAVAPDDPPGPCGRLAGAVVSALVGREDLAMCDLDAWQAAATPGAAAWTTALRLRITGDWRRVTVGPSSSLLERLEYARTLARNLGSSRVLDFVDGIQMEPIADWHRAVLESGSGWNEFGVEAGHRFVEDGYGAEMREIEQVWRRYHQGEASTETLIASLNDRGPASSRAIDWPTWALVLQRHLCGHLKATEYRLKQLGLADESAAWPGMARKQFGSLRLFPIVLRFAATEEAQYKEAMAQVRSLLSTDPELITARISVAVRGKPYIPARHELLPNDVAWFMPHVPTGTALDLPYRTLSEGCPRPVPLPQVERWAAQAPHDMYTAWSLAWLRVPGIPAFADVQRTVGPIAEYDLRAASRMFQYLQGTNEQFLSIARVMCGLSADECDKLGAQLVMNGQEEEAAAVYDTYARKARSSVKVSGSIGWLVNYYWDTDKRERAVELAEAAGDTGSGSGMEILGIVRERQGRDEEAVAIFTEIAGRYQDGGWALAGHDLRQARRTGSAAWVTRAAQQVPKIFPNGIELAQTGWLPAPPPDGMTFKTFGRRAARTGLRASDVVVAVDGYRVHSAEQYHVLARGSFDQKMRFTVWRDGRYQEIAAVVPQRHFGVWLNDHPAAAPAQTVK
jgi:hypothetical protein